MQHVPVLLNEVLQYLELEKGDFVIDGTVDGGGHARAILEKIGSDGRLLGIDWDPELLKACRARLGDPRNAVLKQGNYADLPAILKEAGLPKADALLLDLGFSSEQLRGRGFSFGNDEPLTMTYDPGASPMSELLKEIDEAELAEVITSLGEERYAKRIARAIYSEERRRPIETTKELAEIIQAAVPGRYDGDRLNPATRTFQALRIYANDELGNLRRILGELPLILAPGARVAIISFHSLEDRIVKNVFRDMAKEDKAEILTRKPVEASEQEVAANPRARSAKLRAAKLATAAYL